MCFNSATDLLLQESFFGELLQDMVQMVQSNPRSKLRALLKSPVPEVVQQSGYSLLCGICGTRHG